MALNPQTEVDQGHLVFSTTWASKQYYHPLSLETYLTASLDGARLSDIAPTSGIQRSKILSIEGLMMRRYL